MPQNRPILRWPLPVLQASLLLLTMSAEQPRSMGSQSLQMNVALGLNAPAVFLRTLVWPLAQRIFWPSRTNNVSEWIAYPAFLVISSTALWYWVGYEFTSPTSLFRTLYERSRTQRTVLAISCGLVGLLFLSFSMGKWFDLIGAGHSRLGASVAALSWSVWGIASVWAVFRCIKAKS